MGRRNKKDKVTVTFHYLTRIVEEKDGESKSVPITVEEFEAAMQVIAATPQIDTSTQAGVDELRFSSTGLCCVIDVVGFPERIECVNGW